MFKTIANAFKVKEVRNKILLTLLLLFIFRVGCWLPLPGIDISVFQTTTTDSQFLGLLSSISGGALANGSILALGVSPYISASIIIQLLTVAIPSLERLSKEGGDEGRKKINLYTRIAALVLSVAQAIAIVVAFKDYLTPNATLWTGAPIWLMGTIICLILIAGGMFTVWLGERITDLGIGNGMSLLIFVGILSTAGSALLTAFTNVASDINYLWNILIFVVALLLVFALIVFVDLGETKDVKTIRIYWETRKATEYRIQVADTVTDTTTGEGNWKDVATLTERPSSTTDTITLTNVEKARYVRLYINNFKFSLWYIYFTNILILF